ncbi:hypothetical protein KP509_05G037500 [Ceratopteris richardii]|uniref:Glutaredoxin domain-containing protein n=1 Tax=Ceratopteris richardii TaxID=49495 RepID=A0A8T2USF6_CERRI|nr:hypothetical protein KP509_05G037500 [Ceratopteris richardii]
MAASAFASAFFTCSSLSSSRRSFLTAPHRLVPTDFCKVRLSHPKLEQRQLSHCVAFGPLALRSMSNSSSPSDIEDIIKSKNSENAVVIYSKTWCPYCSRVKSLFNEVKVKPYIVELDELDNEVEVQAALQRLTGQSSVPNVFIGGKHIGGCDDTLRLHDQKKLIPLLKESNAKFH